MADADSINALAVALVDELLAAGRQVATAESCTGGWIAKSITDVAGSSGCFGLGVVSYSNEAKRSILNVDAATLEAHGAVSEATVREMAEGVLALSGADPAVAVSGIAGPDGGTPDKPVGTVWFAWASGAGTVARLERLDGDRDAVRAKSVLTGLQGLREHARQ